MRVELLHIPDCPNYEVAAQLLKEILREHGLPQNISEVSVTDFAQAEVLAFPGSPTIRVDGKDVDPALPEQGYRGLSCRTYIVDGKRQGFPSPAMISLAIRSAISAGRLKIKEPMKHSEKIAPLAAAIGALSTLVCCLPLGIAAAAGAAGLGVVLEPLRPWLLGSSVTLSAIGFVQLYRSRAACQRRSRVSTVVLLFSAMIVLAVVLFPQAVASFLADLVP